LAAGATSSASFRSVNRRLIQETSATDDVSRNLYATGKWGENEPPIARATDRLAVFSRSDFAVREITHATQVSDDRSIS